MADTLSQPKAMVQRAMLFNSASGGHHADHIQHLFEFWRANKPVLYLDIVIAPDFPKLHRSLVDEITQTGDESVRLIPITDEQYRKLNYVKSSKIYARVVVYTLPFARV